MTVLLELVYLKIKVVIKSSETRDTCMIVLQYAENP